MGYLLHILLAVAALGLRDAGWKSPYEWPWVVPIVFVLPHVFGRFVRAAIARGDFRAAELLARALSFVPTVSFIALVALFGWVETVERWCGGGVSFLDWPHPALALVLAPFVLAQGLAIDARARALWSPATGRRWRSFQARMFLSALAPIALYFAVSVVVGFWPALRTRIETVAMYNALFTGAMLLVLGFTLPLLLRNTWETEPVPDGALRERLLRVAELADFRARELLVWRTGNTMSNAAIVGIGARTRVVLFSDLLLAQLDARELAAVFAHEMGHAVKRHVLVFVTLAGGFFLGLDWLANEALGDDTWIVGGFVIAALAAGWASFGWLSRRFELEADLYSMELLHDHSALISALEKVGGGFRDIASWRHFSTARRVDFLTRAAVDPAIGRRLMRVLRAATAAAIALFLLALSLQAWSIVRSEPEQSLRADLRLGAYASAVERASTIPTLDPAFANLVAHAAELGDSAVSLQDLASRARAALRRHDAPDAYAWLALGALRGDGDLARLASAVQATEADPSLDVRAEVGEELWERWGKDLGELHP